ncbi:lipase family protein [Actinokineospora sp. HUAS TT18]|uniref:lipase family protein n=1 Tax=Actinokineospora sp. HUAS TT18 TaxID=3447451 RepID=UPI003F51DA87
MKRTALLLAMVTVFAGAAPAQAAIPEPHDDAFYLPAPGYESAAPGAVLKKRQVIAAGLPATQFQVRSTDAKDRPVTVVSTLIVPPTPYWGQRPLLSYQPATDSLGDQCDPSYTLRTGTEKEAALLGLGLAKGWAVVVTDYQGPRDAYGAGRMEGHAVLDGIRGAISLPEAGLAKAKIGMWGYSGGGLATGWAAELQPTYAPELRIAGVAAGGTPADLSLAAKTIDGGLFAGLGLGAIVGLMREYPELESLLNDAGRALQAEIGDMCVAELAARYPFRRIAQYTNSPDPLNEPVAKQVLALNRMGTQAPTAPVYLYHSKFDELIPWAAGDTVRREWCAKGTRVSFHTDYLSEHNVLAVTGAPAAVGYLAARFAGFPLVGAC